MRSSSIPNRNVAIASESFTISICTSVSDRVCASHRLLESKGGRTRSQGAVVSCCPYIDLACRAHGVRGNGERGME